ncbi:MAG: hypothetical protein SVU32_04490 [Candidatus Nanohaloarchaea archaeon]|nr:hypothetical protein [Candidatus Nanohaloarchaea archaeon]
MAVAETPDYGEAFRRDVERISWETDDAEGCLSMVDVFVHPGFYSYYSHHFDVDEPYDTYRDRLTSLVDETDADRVLVLYPESWWGETSSLLPASRSDIQYVRTSEKSALLDDESRAELASVITELQAGGTVRVAGELNGCCYTHVRQLFEEVEERVEKDYHVVEGLAYPEDELLTV